MAQHSCARASLLMLKGAAEQPLSQAERPVPMICRKLLRAEVFERGSRNRTADDAGNSHLEMAHGARDNAA